MSDKQIVREALDEYVDEYEFCGDYGSYVPSDREKAIILDAIIGWEALDNLIERDGFIAELILMRKPTEWGGNIMENEYNAAIDAIIALARAR